MQNINSFSKVLILTSLSLLAFAANSVLCRLALGEGVVDAAGFTIVRLLSGALVLLLLLFFRRKGNISLSSGGSWEGCFYLTAYAVAFSYAYISIDTATGALVLFAAVQLSMLFMGFIKGDRLSPIEWGGVFLAFGGLVYLLLPKVQTPSLQGFVLMILAGIAWGLYSLNGKGSSNPFEDTAGNFIRSIPLMLVMAILMWPEIHLSNYGVALAIASGALASALGYTLWYMALPSLQRNQAAVVQLLVPVIAAVGGVLFVGESLNQRLIVASVMTLGGILLVVLKPFSKG